MRGGVVLLAAGSASRFGSDKRAHVLPDGHSLLSATITKCIRGFGEVIVVLKPGDDALAEELRQQFGPGAVTIVHAQDARLGMGHSLAAGISAVYRDLGDRMEDVVLMTMSEFGRTVAENGSGGTDHGHANCMLILGGAVRGGSVLGDWPGLAREQLYQGRDLALTTDYRDVLWEILGKRLGSPGVRQVFTDGKYRPKPVGLV